MAYIPFDETVPDGSTQTGPQVTPSIRNNQRALADSVFTDGLLGWDLTVTGPDFSKPSMLTYENGTGHRIRATITWNVQDDPSTILYERDYGSGWETLGTKTFAWNASSELLGITWS